MKLHATSTSWLSLALWLLPSLLLTACFHKTPPPQARIFAPPISTAPKPNPVPVELPLEAMMIPSEPLMLLPVIPQSQRPRPPVRLKPPAGTLADQAAAASAQPAAESPAVSAIGQLSSGDSPDLRNETVDSIASIERDLTAISRKLTTQGQQKTAVQIKEYLRQARAALNSGDVDGAYTLAAKAKVLLSELSR